MNIRIIERTVTFTTRHYIVTVLIPPFGGSPHVMVATPHGQPITIDFDMLSQFVQEAVKALASHRPS